MVKVIMGLKGSGKTKKLIELIKEAETAENGNVVCIERKPQLTYDIPYSVRLIAASDYNLVSYDVLKGFISGLHAGNYDITNVYIDNLYKTIGVDRAAGEEFILWCAEFAKTNNMEITVTVSDDPALASEEIKKFL